MPSQIKLSEIYELVGRGGSNVQGDNLSLRSSAIGLTPAVNELNVSATYNLYGNAAPYSPIGPNRTSMGSISDWMSTDFDDASMRFKFNPLAGIAAELMGDRTQFPRTFPNNLGGALGIRMNNTATSAGSVPGTFAYGVSSYTTWTSVASGDSYKLPNISATSATICIWFKPTTPASGNRNWIWADMDAINDFNPYRGWWLAYTSANILEFNRGDGLGNTSGNRRSFAGSATFNGSAAKWQFAAIIISNSDNTASSTSNWMYAYVWNGSAYVWSNGATTIAGSPGSGGAMAWSVDSGTETTNCMIINPLVGTGFQHELGHMYVFGGALTQTQVEYVRDMTDTYT
jgi:hypothetical protein